MCLHDRRTFALAALLVCVSTAALTDSSSTTAAPDHQIIWKNGELVPPLPDDPALRASVRDQIAKRAATRSIPAGTPTLTYGVATLSAVVQATPVLRVHTVAPGAPDPTFDRWLADLQSRLRPPGAAPKPDGEKPQAAAGAVSEDGAPAFSPAIITSFDGVDDTGLRPGAPDIAAGPDHIVVATTDRFAVMDKCGNTLLTDTFRHFLSLSATTSQYTPRVIYDEWNFHWIIVFISTETNYSASNIYVMYTVGPDPTGPWGSYSFPTLPGLKDFPGVATTPFGVYLTWDQYNLSSFAFETALIGEIDKVDFYNGGGTAMSIRTGMTNPGDASLAFSIRPAQMHTFNGYMYFINDKVQGGSFLTLWALSGNPGSSSLSAFSASVPAYTPPPDIGQVDATLMDSGDCRVLDAVYANGHLYETHGEGFAGSPVVDVWYIDTYDLSRYLYRKTSSLNNGTAYGAIDVDGNDQVALVYSFWGNASNPGLGYQFLQFPSGLSLGGGVLLFGQDSFNSGSQPYRWGPYNGCARDPIDDRTMWIYGLYASNSPLDSWATKAAAITMFNPGALAIDEPAYYSGGFVGGPFSSDTFTYTLHNLGETVANWKLSGIPSWLTASTTFGHLNPSESQSISLHLSPVAYTLGEGAYSTFLNFQNCTGSGSASKFVGLGIGRDGSCPGAALPLYPKEVAPSLTNTFQQPGMYITAIEDVDVCAVDITARLVDRPQLAYARVYAANGVTRGALLAESFIDLVRPDNVTHSIPLAVHLDACKEYEVSVEFTGLVNYDTYNELSLGLPKDVGGVVRMRNSSVSGNASFTEAAQIQLSTAASQGCEGSTIVDLGGPTGIGALANPDVGVYVQPRRTVRLCSVAMNFGASAGTKLTAKVYASFGTTRDYLVAEGSAVVSLPYLNYVEVPISAQLVGGYEYDIAVQVQGTAFYEVDTSASVPAVNGPFNVIEGERGGIYDAAPTLRIGWTEDTPGTQFSLAKPGGPPPLSLGNPFSQGAFVTSLIKQEIYGLGVYADVPAGDYVSAFVYTATGNTRGSLVTTGSVISDASGPRWHIVPLGASLLNGQDYDLAVSAPFVTAVPAWLDTSGLPFTVAGVLNVRNGEKDGFSSNDKLVFMRMLACNATATPVAGPVRTPMFLGPPAPNPAGGLVRFGYALESEGPVEITIYDVSGRRVAGVLANTRAAAGAAQANFDASNLASGVYFVRLTTPGKSVSRKFVVTH